MFKMTIKDILMGEETLFRNVEAFNPDYIPDRLLHRDLQMEALAMCLRPALRGGKPKNAVILGAPATGKTTALRKVFQMVEETSDKLYCVYVNCQISTTRFNIFSDIYEHIMGHRPPETGIPFSRIYGEIMKKLVQEEKALIVALDDVNHLFYSKNANQVFYDILRAHEVFKGARTGLFAIISDIEFRFMLDKNVSSIFIPKEVIFHPYTKEQMEDILGERVKVGFYPDVVSGKVLERISELTYSTGDMRLGIDILSSSGDLAEAESSKAIQIKHVEEAVKNISPSSLEGTLEALSPLESALLRLIANTPDDENTAGSLYQSLKKEKKISYASFDRALKKLELLRIIDTRFTGKGVKGNSRLVILRFSPEEMGKFLG
ncbi:MAG TPA: ORC1-type DNA replication protein [Methanobacteriaceae archaeon]|nr:ORC1-type DNA replication protein [Methanobacteriaceae archaeon]